MQAFSTIILLAVISLLAMPARPAHAQKSPPALGQGMQLAQVIRPNTQAVPLRDPVTDDLLRYPDTRPQRDAGALAEKGIERYASDRLVLFTDVPAAQAAGLPSVIDQAYAEWASYFGDLPASPQRTDFQMTGFVFADEARFAAGGLLPADLPNFVQGRHRGQEFWFRDPGADYYRRHLLIHEATHCFMTAVPRKAQPPIWYLEGMAEYFATHRITDDGHLTGRVFPDRPENFRGLGRIETLQDEVRAGRQLDIRQVLTYTNEEFADDRKVPYAWSWALCAFLDNHPRYREKFRALANDLEGEVFLTFLNQAFLRDRILLAAEFHEFGRRIIHGYDFSRNQFQVGTSSATLNKDVEISVKPNFGWQASGIVLVPNTVVELSATGTVELGHVPAPWTSEPQGISIRYCDGVPIGALLGGLLPTERGLEEGEMPQMLTGVIGQGTTLTVTRQCHLYFRVNDFANDLAGNTGAYKVTVRPVPAN